MGFVVSRGWWFSRDHQLTLLWKNLLGREFQVRSFAAASDRSYPPPGKRPDGGHTSSTDQCTFVHPPPGTTWVGVSILWDINPRTCRPLRDELYPCTPSSLFKSLLPYFSPIHAVQEAFDNKASPIGRSSAPRSLATPHHPVVRTQLSRFLVRTPTGHDARR